MSDDARRECQESARWIARNVPRAAYERALPAMLGVFHYEIRVTLSVLAYTAAWMPEELAKVLDAARAGPAALDVWHASCREIVDDITEASARAWRFHRTWYLQTSQIESAYSERLRAGEALIEAYGEAVPVSLYAVLSSTLARVDSPRAPAMPEGLSPALRVRASPHALQTFLARTLELRCRDEAPVTLSLREEGGRAVLSLHQSLAGARSTPGLWVEGFLLHGIAREAGVREERSREGGLETTAFAFDVV